MTFDLKDIREANQIIEVLIETNPNPIYLIDHDKKIRYANKAFSNFIDKHPDQIILHNFCQTIGCIYYSNKNEPVRTQCKICRLDELILKPVEKEISLVREFIFANKPELKYLQYNFYPVPFQDELLFMVIIHDLTGDAMAKIPLSEVDELK